MTHLLVTWWSHGGHMVVTWWSHGGHVLVTTRDVEYRIIKGSFGSCSYTRILFVGICVDVGLP